MEKVLISGCSSGFGYQTALLLDQNNFDVTATTRKQDFVFENTTIKHLYLDMTNLPESFEDYDIVKVVLLVGKTVSLCYFQCRCFRCRIS